MKTISKHINLTKEDRVRLRGVLTSGNPNQILRANILLMSDANAGKPFRPAQIAVALNTSNQTINVVKEQYLSEGLDRVLTRKNKGKAPHPAKITGDIEARIIQLACSQAPNGRTRWTLRLLSEKIVELAIVDSLSHMQVKRILKKRNLSLT